MPSPLHPALVHFPIVLILLGTVIALVAAFTPRWHLRWIAAATLLLGALGTVAATQTGEEDGEAVEHRPGVETALDLHEEWAERTLGFAIATGAFALAAAAITTRWPRVAQGASLLTLLLALGASYCVFQTGHYGGQLVYRHGAGVNLAPATGMTTPPPADPARTKRTRQGDDDDS